MISDHTVHLWAFRTSDWGCVWQPNWTLLYTLNTEKSFP